MLSDTNTPYFAPDNYRTPTFMLGSYRPSDGALIREAVSASYDHLKTFMVWATPNQKLEDSEALARRFCANYLLNTDYVMGIFSPDRNVLLGGTGYHLRWGPRETLVAEIGMWIRSSAAGKGVGTEVLRALLRWGFTDWGWERLVWRCDTRNVASARVAEKAGMRLEGTLLSDEQLPDGTWRDTHLFAMLRREFQLQ
jgi:RimJ/RimL family protein N-acetyltransferase